MNRVAIDMSPVVHGSRAVKRCTFCMTSELLKYESIDFDLLYFDYRHQTPKYLRPLKGHVKESVIRVPQRLLIPFWKRFSWPNLELLLSKPGLFYVNEFYFPPTKNALVVATIHGLAYKVIPEKLPRKSVESLGQGLSFVLKHADCLIAVSETTKEELIRYVGVAPERIYVITHGVDKEFRQLTDGEAVRDRLRDRYGLKHPYILYVGAIAIHKNVMGVLAAYQMVAAKAPHDLVMVGPPDTAWDQAHRFVDDTSLSGRVHFLGTVDQAGDSLLNLYNGADLFVFPSFYEGWTSPPLEAMACGVPVVTSNCSSMPETVRDAALKIDPEDPEALAYHIEKVLSDNTLRTQLVKMGLDHVSSHTWEKAAKKLINVFTDVRARGPWRGKNNEGCH
jgi:glycosyltransferase involved in cell wall biosynthesis